MRLRDREERQRRVGGRRASAAWWVAPRVGGLSSALHLALRRVAQPSGSRARRSPSRQSWSRQIWIARTNSARRCGAEQALEGGAFKVAWRAARGCVTEAVAHFAQLANRGVELVRFGAEQLSINPRARARGEHAQHLVEREACDAPESDERQALEDSWFVQPAQAAPTDGRDEPLLFVESKRRGGDAGLLSYLADVENTHGLDLKST